MNQRKDTSIIGEKGREGYISLPEGLEMVSIEFKEQGQWEQ